MRILVSKFAILLGFCLGTCAQAKDAEINADQLGRLLRAVLSPVRDVEFVYEGDIRRLDGTVDPLCVRYQGTYAFKPSDASSYLEVYRFPSDGTSPYTRAVGALKGFELEWLHQTPDLDKVEMQPIRTAGGSRSFEMNCSPTWYFYYWYLQLLAHEEYGYAESCAYEYQGVESVDGNRCIRIQLNEVPGAVGPNRSLIKLWLDPERGFNPLKIELWRNGTLSHRTHSVRLKHFSFPDGQGVWLPIYGENDYGDSATSPKLLREKCYMVEGSLKLNQNLKDSRFSVGWKSRDPAYVRGVQQDIASRPRAAQMTSTTRTDPDGVQQQLDEELAKADAQARQLLASGQNEDDWSGLYGMTLVFVGIALFAVVVVTKVRQR